MDLVQESEFLSALPGPAAEVLAAAAHSRTLRPRDFGVRQGDPSMGLLWLHTGLLSVFYELADGTVHVHRVAWPDEVSTQGAIEDTEYPSSCVALIPSQFFWVPREIVDRAFKDFDGLAHSLFTYIARQEERLAVWTSHLLSLPVMDRLRLVLARMVVEMGKAEGGGHVLSFPVTNGALAVAAHVSRDEAGRAVRELSHKGVLARRQGRQMVVPDLNPLLGPTLAPLAARLGLSPGAGRATR
jgi:CRP-like cAMP-binding protein